MNVLTKEYLAHQVRLRFYDIDVTIESDSGTFIGNFARLYRRFCTENQPSASPASLYRDSIVNSAERSGELRKTCTEREAVQRNTREPASFKCIILSNPDNPWGRQVMICNGEVWPISDQRLLEGYAYEVILSAIITRLRSHLLVHAGVVSCNGQGVIIVANTMHGKTTLVLELVRRGFRFLSDEMAALGRCDHTVHPFPRSLWIRRGTLELTGLSGKAVNAPEWMDKFVFDIEEIIPDSLGAAAPVKHIIMLHNPDEVKVADVNRVGQDVCVMIDRFDDEFLDDVRRGEGITNVRKSVYLGYPALRLWAERPNAALSAVELLCRQYKILVMDVVKGERERPTFKAGATIQKIPASQAVVGLLGHYLGGYLSDVLHNEFAGSSTRLFMELLSIVGNARCYRISVGPLGEVADLVCEAVNGGLP
ncbi:MAG: hypothetical protein IT451_01990 [Candidatus Brocadia sp.]|nr:hypothetical protein [Candidatus Brocadia sp.]